MGNSIEMKEDMTLNVAEQKVLQAIVIYNRPVTVQEIANELDMSLKTAHRVFKSLEEKGNIVAYSSGGERHRYYSVTNSKTGLDELLSQKYVDIAGALEKQYIDIKKENEYLREQIDKLYSNILTLMGIFVAIFALIVINVNAIGVFASTMKTSQELFVALIKLNIPLVVSIVLLVILIKILLLPKQKNDK